ncbi:type II toxin-antitoxin system VapC family toxin [Methylobacterium sp.]|uniref:type II toxin-antitoxin system VapC family toxin n=1 Tax=Methylobacterium sp. TaxID=409 RepID=UPI003B00D4C4
MRAYLDASVLVALLTDDPLTARADTLFRALAPIPVVSDFAAAEFASALGRRVRTKEIDAERAKQAFADLDRWSEAVAERVDLVSSDVTTAAGFLRRLDITLRTPDALNIALCRRVAATLATFDDKMAAVARTLGVPVLFG